MKKLYLLVILFLTLASGSIAQNHKQGRPETVEAIKIAYFTKKLNLSPEEAQKFWPIYNQYFEEIRQIRQQNRDLDEVDMEEKIVNVRKKYREEFAKALPGDRVNQFFKVDKEFTMFLRKELQERNDMRQLRQKQRP
jgi:hypothetical protein